MKGLKVAEISSKKTLIESQIRVNGNSLYAFQNGAIFRSDNQTGQLGSVDQMVGIHSGRSKTPHSPGGANAGQTGVRPGRISAELRNPGRRCPKEQPDDQEPRGTLPPAGPGSAQP